MNPSTHTPDALRARVIQKTLRVPLDDDLAVAGLSSFPTSSVELARQMDAALLSVGFAPTPELRDAIAALSADRAQALCRMVVDALRERVGDHVAHNTYFIDFPRNVPDTVDFWTSCIVDALGREESAEQITAQLDEGHVNLLDLPKYGRYQHTYEEMIAARDAFVERASDRVTPVHLGESLQQESHKLYLKLAQSEQPLGEEDTELLRALAPEHITSPQPSEIPIRESRAIVAAARLREGEPIELDTPTDALRVAAELSGGDVSLSEPTEYSSKALPRRIRRALLSSLDQMIARDPSKLSQVPQRSEQFKRLAERLHPGDYPKLAQAQRVFSVARAEETARSQMSEFEAAMSAGDTAGAVEALQSSPGLLIRQIDRIAREASPADRDLVIEPAGEAIGASSTRVLLSLCEHLRNRIQPDPARIFTNTRGRSFVTSDTRAPIPERLRAVLERAAIAELRYRLPSEGRFVIAPEAMSIALPTTGKGRPDGIGILPRGSVQPAPERIRFFIHWREREQRTDYDLSALTLDESFQALSHVSYTNLSDAGMTHSGDITEAPEGASEFIDLNLDELPESVRYVVPQVNKFSGEAFDHAAEAFFGFAASDEAMRGKPFEPRLVRAKSDISGSGRVSLPLIFCRGDQGWEARWMHLTLAGYPNFNQVEANHVSTAMLARAIVQRDYLRVEDLAEWLREAGAEVSDSYDPQGAAVTYLGVEQPEALPQGSVCYTGAEVTEVFAD